MQSLICGQGYIIDWHGRAFILGCGRATGWTLTSVSAFSGAFSRLLEQSLAAAKPVRLRPDHDSFVDSDGSASSSNGHRENSRSRSPSQMHNRQPTSFVTGLGSGITSLYGGLSSGVTGIVTAPLQGFCPALPFRACTTQFSCAVGRSACCAA